MSDEKGTILLQNSKKIRKKFWRFRKISYLCTVKSSMRYEDRRNRLLPFLCPQH